VARVGSYRGPFYAVITGPSVGNYVAGKASDKYHTPDCGIGKNIKAENKITFATQEEAQKAGYSPCAVCMSKKAKLVASKGSDKYHLSECRIAENIKQDNLITFKSPAEAVKAGYSPCGICNPPNPEAGVNKDTEVKKSKSEAKISEETKPAAKKKAMKRNKEAQI
jgi:methylphosphotriester-DNA--protein-cysteine methyltransferase